MLDIITERLKESFLKLSELPAVKNTRQTVFNGVRTIRFTMLATYLAVTLITLILMCVYIIGILSENLYSEETMKLYAKANMLSQTAAENWDAPDTNVQYLRFKDITDRSLAGTSIRGVITNNSYTVLYDNNSEANMAGKVFMREVLKLALDGAQSDSMFSADTGRSLAVAVPIEREGVVIGGVYLAESVSFISETIRTIQTSLIVFSILILFVIGILSIGVSYIVTQPFSEFTEVAKAISKGDFSKRVSVRGMSEIAQMGTALNFMCDELSALDIKRRNFVSDVSHELKTPMAGIKLLCDSLVEAENPPIETVREFLGDISEEIDRLTRIINRLLTLSRLDASNDITDTPVDINPLCAGVVRGLRQIAEGKNTLLSLIPGSGETIVKADYDKLYESVYNIVDNAIKYTPEGGIVKVRTISEAKYCVIEVEDNGPGIPDSEKQHIFERFYRLDDSRARDTGGTGLGLAIAREAVAIYGGTIDVESVPDGGSIFRIRVPKDNGGAQ